MINNVSNTLPNTNLIHRYQKNVANNRVSNSSIQTPDTEIKSIYKDPNLTHTSWFYINDLHGKMTKMERIVGMAQKFDSTPSSKWGFFNGDNVSKFKVSSGDIVVGANYKNNQVAGKFLDWSGFIASALGNHEMDVAEPDNLAKLLQDTKCKVLAINVETIPNSPLVGKFEKSMVIEKDGEKYGIIGIAPSDMFDRVKMNNSLQHIKVKNTDETIKLVQQEVNDFKKQGINKIILLSHSGLPNDKRMAQELDGVDIIFSAHTHDLIKDIKEDENLLYSKSGEPVVITQAGKNGENVGVLNVDFDKDGIIKKVQNNVIPVAPYNRTMSAKYAIESIIGKPEIVGKVGKSVPQPKNTLIEDNPHGNIIADAMRNELNTDIAILNSGNIRGGFTSGSEVDSRLLADISPFEDKMMILNLSEKQIVDAIKNGLQLSFNSKTNKPGILLVSGLKYKCNKQGELLGLEFIDKEKKSHPIDVKNPSADKKYTVAADDFFATGGDNYLPVNKHPDFVLQTFEFDKNKLACDYIKKLQQPFDVDYDGRIEIV